MTVSVLHGRAGHEHAFSRRTGPRSGSCSAAATAAGAAPPFVAGSAHDTYRDAMAGESSASDGIGHPLQCCAAIRPARYSRRRCWSGSRASDDTVVMHSDI